MIKSLISLQVLKNDLPSEYSSKNVYTRRMSWSPTLQSDDCEIIQERSVYKHPLFGLCEFSFRMKNHQKQWTEEQTYLRLDLSDVVVMLCHDVARDCFVMVEQCRPVLKFSQPHVSPWTLEVPAGYIDTNESPEQAVRREVLEEIGTEAHTVSCMLHHSSTGLNNSNVYTFYVTVDSSQISQMTGIAQENEYIKTHVIDFASVQRLITEGSVISSGTLMAFYVYLSKIRYPHQQS